MKHIFASTAVAALLTSGAAMAADMPIKAPPPVVSAWSWAGWYVGAHMGGAWGTKEWSDLIYSTFTSTTTTTVTLPGQTIASYGVNGPLFGGQIGYNWQSGWIVYGIEAQASWSDIKGTQTCRNLPGQSSNVLVLGLNCSTKVDSLGTVAFRLGGTVDHALLYAKVGWAWAHDKHSISGRFSLSDESVQITGIDSSKTMSGWMLGAGVEYMFTSNWSGKLEYNYMDLGHDRFAFEIRSLVDRTIGTRYDMDVNQRMHLIKVGLNYHFTPWISARY